MNQYRPTAAATEISAAILRALLTKIALPSCRSGSLPCARRQRRAHRLRCRTEQNQTAILENERNTQRQNELSVMAIPFDSGYADAGHARDQQAVQQVTAHEQDGPGADRGDEGRGNRPQHSDSAEGSGQVQGDVHSQHQEVALREVDHPHYAEDQAEAKAHQAVDAPHQQPGRQRLQEALGEGREPAHDAGAVASISVRQSASLSMRQDSAMSSFARCAPSTGAAWSRNLSSSS